MISKMAVSHRGTTLSQITISSVTRKYQRIRTHPLLCISACVDTQYETPCGGSCTFTCGDVSRMCVRECIPGCKCPRRTPVLHEGKCIAKTGCPSDQGTPPFHQNVIWALFSSDSERRSHPSSSNKRKRVKTVVQNRKTSQQGSIIFMNL